jgi:hypothetical protein
MTLTTIVLAHGYLRRVVSRARTRQLFFSVGTTPHPPPYTELPSPTWSIGDLQLDQKHEPVSITELAVLAKRALISLPLLDSMKRTDQLRQDLGNMLHMIRQVQGFAETAEESLTDADIYDRPRGVRAAPVRGVHGDENEARVTLEQEEARQVWETLLKPKTTALGSHSYFVIATHREEMKNKKKE